VTSAPDLPCNKRARREDAGDDLGRAEEDRRSPRLELVASEARVEEPARLEAPANAVSIPAAATEAEPTQAGETASAEAATSPPAIGEIAAGDVAAASASSDPPGQEDTREAAAKTVKRPRRPRGSWSPQSRLPRPLPALRLHRTSGL
jgi:hypothetical protein